MTYLLFKTNLFAIDIESGEIISTTYLSFCSTGSTDARTYTSLNNVFTLLTTPTKDYFFVNLIYKVNSIF